MAKQPAKGRKPAAKRAKPAPKPTESSKPDKVEDAVVAQNDAPEVEPVNAESAAEESREAIVVTDPQLASEGEPDPATQSDIAPDAETTQETPETAPTPAAVVAQPQQRGGFIPLVLGGALAGLIGYGFAYFQNGDAPGTSDADLARLTAVEEAVAAIPAPVEPEAIDLSGIESALADLDASVADLAARVAVLERQPSGDGTLQETALAAYQADIDALRAQIETQQSELQAMAEAAASQLDATRAEAQAIEQNAVDAARAATARAALARVQAALESGAPIGAVLTEMGDTLDEPVPDALLAVADGAPTLAALQTDFPAAARAALASARAEGADGEDSGGLGAFFRNQFDVRSVAPREGDSVDAILSRAEDALRTGRLSDALAEVATLPEVSRAAMSDWTAQAELRAAAIDAADTLATTLNDN